MKKPKEEVIFCKSNLSNCFCEEEKGHEGLHKCRCGGSWDDDFNPHSYPDISGGFGSFPLRDWEKEELNKTVEVTNFEQGVAPTKPY